MEYIYAVGLEPVAGAFDTVVCLAGSFDMSGHQLGGNDHLVTGQGGECFAEPDFTLVIAIPLSKAFGKRKGNTPSENRYQSQIYAYALAFGNYGYVFILFVFNLF